LAGNRFGWGYQLRIITIDASPSDAELFTTSSTGYHYNYNITKSKQIIAWTNYTTGCDSIEGEAKLTTYDKTIVATNYTSHATIDGLNGTILASTWVATE
jgi:hypothetical protein